MAAFKSAAFALYADDAFSGLHYVERVCSPSGEPEVCIKEAQVIKEFTKAAAVADTEPALEPSIELPAAPNIPQPHLGVRVCSGRRTSIFARSSTTSTRRRCSRTSGSSRQHRRKITDGRWKRNTAES